MQFAAILRPVRKSDGVAALVIGLFHARTVLHVLHLQTSSYAQHMALDELYKALPELADQFIEAYQGIYGKVMAYPQPPQWPMADAVTFVQTLKDWFNNARTQAPGDSELQNLLDEVASAIDSTMYKLKNLH